MDKEIRIGTRNSQLALWQAYLVQKKLTNYGYKTKIVEISSKGDETIDTPLHQIGYIGLFTKKLDNAILKGDIDIAVHSLKDVPTDLPKKIVQAAVLERHNSKDILIYKKDLKFLKMSKGIVATGSLRRKSQWLSKYPKHKVTSLRGNINTRLQKLKNNNWNGAIFAMAGIQRIDILPKKHLILDWMVPAPAQGAITITSLKNNVFILEACAKLNHYKTQSEVAIERQFMKTLEGGCTAPIGANATIKNNEIYFKGILSTINGSDKIEIEKTVPLNQANTLGILCAKKILDKGGIELIRTIKL